MRCDRQLRLSFDAPRYDVFFTRCKCWQCETCAPLQLHKLRLRIAAGAPDMLLTLTCKLHPDEDPPQAAKRMIAAWKLLRQRWQRVQQMPKLPFFLIIEKTKSGLPHFHIALRAKFISQSWLSKNWLELTGAKIVDVRRIRAAHGAVRYLTKYLTKSPERFGRLQRYSSSRDWVTAKIKSKRPTENATMKSISGVTVIQLLALARSQGDKIITSSKHGFSAILSGENSTPPLWNCTTDLEAYPRAGIALQRPP